LAAPVDHGQALAKVEREGACRNCGSASDLWPVYTVGAEKQNEPWHELSALLWVHPDAVVPLCAECRQLRSRGRLSLLDLLTEEEQNNAVRAAGGILPAVKALVMKGGN